MFKDQKQFEQVAFRANAKLKKDNRRLDELASKIIQVDETLKDISKQIENIVDFIAKGDISKGVATKKIIALQKREAELKKERKKLELGQSLLVRETSAIKKIKETRMWWLEYAERLDEDNKRELIDTLIERIEVYPRSYTERDARIDDTYGGGREAGFGTKVSLNIIGHIKIKGLYKLWEE